MFLLLPVTLNYFSPYVIIDGLANKVISGAFVVWSLMFITSLFFGRAFCAYVCPYGGMQMLVDQAYKKPLKEIGWLRKVRYGLGVVWLGAILAILFKNITAIGLDFFYLTENFISVDNLGKLIFYYILVILLLLAPLFLGKRASCHYVCPMSILNILGTKFRNMLNIPSLRLQPASSKCVNCKQCNKACPMSLDISRMVQNEDMNNTECILCGECCKACKTSAVRRVYGKNFIAKDKHITSKL
jgi:polyferredoxin